MAVAPGEHSRAKKMGAEEEHRCTMDHATNAADDAQQLSLDDSSNGRDHYDGIEGRRNSSAMRDVMPDNKPVERTTTANEGKALKVAIYGAVNAMMAIPVLYGYATIIFRCAVANGWNMRRKMMPAETCNLRSARLVGCALRAATKRPSIVVRS